MAPETLKLNVGISSNGDVDVGEISLADMDPEDIRVRNYLCKIAMSVIFISFCILEILEIL
jgi:hypothetical protein